MKSTTAPARARTLALALAALGCVFMPFTGTAASRASRLAAASDPAALYQVEMVVFRALAVGPTESWDTVPLGRGFGSPASRNGDVPMVVRVLSPSDYRLDGVVYGLRANGSWQTVAHAAWVQTAPPWGTHVGVSLSEVGVRVPGLEGTVYLERAPIYLHLGFNVSLKAGAAGGAQPGTTYTISEMRNIRQNEKQYYDHPAFGIIAVVTAIKASVR